AGGVSDEKERGKRGQGQPAATPPDRHARRRNGGGHDLPAFRLAATGGFARVDAAAASQPLRRKDSHPAIAWPCPRPEFALSQSTNSIVRVSGRSTPARVASSKKSLGSFPVFDLMLVMYASNVTESAPFS